MLLDEKNVIAQQKLLQISLLALDAQYIQDIQLFAKQLAKNTLTSAKAQVKQLSQELFTKLAMINYQIATDALGQQLIGKNVKAATEAATILSAIADSSQNNEQLVQLCN